MRLINFSIKKSIIIFCFCFTCGFIFSQSRELDSLKLILKTSKDDTVKVKTTVLLCRNLAIVGEYRQSVDYLQPALKVAIALNLKKQEAAIESCYGFIMMMVGNYPEALIHHFRALKISEATNDRRTMGIAHNNLGNVYTSTGNFEEALKHYHAIIKLKEEDGDKMGAVFAIGNLGALYGEMKNYPEALKYFRRGKEIDSLKGDEFSLSYDYSNIANIYLQQKNYNGALSYQLTSIKIREKYSDFPGLINSYINTGTLFLKMGNLLKARGFLVKALDLSKNMNAKSSLKEIYMLFSNIDSIQGRPKEAFENYKLYISYRDSLFNEENTKKTVRAQMNYEFDKKDQLTKLEQAKKDDIAKQEKEKQIIVRNSFIAGFVLVLLLAILILRGYRNKQKANLIITKQKEEVELAKKIIEHQKKEVEEKQKEVLDSIHYAKRIQTALITNEKYITKNLNRLINQ